MSKSPRTNLLMASRLDLVNKILGVIGKMEDPSSPLLLVFWGSRGSGKTTFLEEAKRQLSSEPNMAIAGLWDLSTSNPQELSEKILKAVRKKKSKYKAVLLDNMDVLLKDPSGRDFFDFENNTILPLIEQGDTLILIGNESN